MATSRDTEPSHRGAGTNDALVVRNQAPLANPAKSPSLLDSIVSFFGTPEGKATLFGAGVVFLGVLFGVAAERSSRQSRRRAPSPRPRPAFDVLDFLPDSTDQLASNRAKGATFEAQAEGVLRDLFPEKAIIPQVHVTTPRGKTRRADYAIAHANGAITAVEVKNVPVVTEKHVRQAEDHRAGVQNTFKARSGRPILVVPEHTIVSEEHAAKVRVLRVRT